MSSIYDFVIRKGVLRRYAGTDIHPIVPKGVVSVGSFAFQDCPYLASVVLPEGVTKISKRAFEDCRELTGVTLPDSVTFIGYYAFAKCYKLTDIQLPKGLTYLGAASFWNCKKLTHITIPASVTSVESNVFAECINMTHVTVEEGAAISGKIFNDLFCDCKKPEVIVAPGIRLEELEPRFKPAAALGYLTNAHLYQDPEILSAYHRYIVSKKKQLLPYLLENDLVQGLSVLTELVKIDVDNFERDFLTPAMEANASQCVACLLEWKDNHISQEDMDRKMQRDLMKNPYNVQDMSRLWKYKKLEDGTLCITGYKGQDQQIHIPPMIGKTPVTAIGDAAFSPNEGNASSTQKQVLRNLRSVTIPEGIVTIGSDAFEGCQLLTEPVFPGTLTSIGSYAFCLCHSLTRVTIPGNVQTVERSAFSICAHIREATICAGVKTICSRVFFSCRQLQKVTVEGKDTVIEPEAIPSSVSVIHAPDGSFAHTYALENGIPFQSL